MYLSRLVIWISRIVAPVEDMNKLLSVGCLKLLFVGVIMCISPCCLFGQSAFEFIENKGQWNDDVKFRASLGHAYVEITNTGYRVRHGFDKSMNVPNFVEGNSSKETRPTFQHSMPNLVYQTYEVAFEGGSKEVQIKAVGASQTYYNYYIGNDPKRWGSKCIAFKEVWFYEIYPHVNVHFYQKNGEFKYDIIIDPKGNVDQVRLKYLYIDKVERYGKNELKIQTSPNYYLFENMPLVYEQMAEDYKRRIACAYNISSANIVSFNLNNKDVKNPIVIDPEFKFSTFSGSKVHNLAYCSSFDNVGNFLGGSIVFGSGFPKTGTNTDYNINNRDLPVGNGQTQQAPDAAFMKLSADGVNNIAATVFGSNGIDQPLSIKEAPDKTIIIVGKTDDAKSFPNPTNQPSLGNPGGYDLFVVKLNAATGELLASKVIGGSGDDVFVNTSDFDAGGKIFKSGTGIYGDVANLATAFDDSNRLIIVGPTLSTDFPVVGSPHQTSNPTGQIRHSGFLLKIKQDLTKTYYSGYLGGDNMTFPHDIEFNASDQRLYIVGSTLSSTLPAALNTNNGFIDGYVMKVKNNTDSYIIEESRFIGSPGNDKFDAVYNIDFDRTFFPYIVGSSTGTMPVDNVGFSQTGGSHFIQKYSKDFSTAVYSTTFGPSNEENLPAITISTFLVDHCENVYVAGWGGPAFIANSWKKGFAVNATKYDPLRSDFDATGDYYIMVLEKGAKKLLLGGFLGAVGPPPDNPMSSSLGDHFHYGENRFDDNGVLYQTVCVCGGGTKNVKDFPVSSAPIWSSGIGKNRDKPEGVVPSSSFCNAAYVKILFDYDGVKSQVSASSDNGRTFTQTIRGCVPLKVIIADQSLKGNKGKTFYWFFEQDSTSRQTTTDTIHHTFQKAGKSRVRLISENPDVCIVRDTSYININILEGEISMSFVPKLMDCSRVSLKYTFDNTTQSTIHSIAKTVFTWNFGDGSPPVTSIGAASVTHTYAKPGTYKAKLTYDSALFCRSNNIGDSFVRKVHTQGIVLTGHIPQNACKDAEVKLMNTAYGYDKISVDWGDGSPIDVPAVEGVDSMFTHVYTKTGSYVVTMRGLINACNESTTSTFPITIIDKPIVDFSISPIIPGTKNDIVPNVTAIFQNLSSNVATAVWHYGDGTTDMAFNGTHLFTKTGEYDVKLVATSIGGCADSMIKKIRAVFIPILDVASGFSPNGDNINDEIGVESFGVKEVKWKIYDREGVLIFESDDINKKWNGRDLNGELVPIDTYFYSVEALFKGDQKLSKSGEITLLK